jgi:hypothetical protein
VFNTPPSMNDFSITIDEYSYSVIVLSPPGTAPDIDGQQVDATITLLPSLPSVKLFQFVSCDSGWSADCVSSSHEIVSTGTQVTDQFTRLVIQHTTTDASTVTFQYSVHDGMESAANDTVVTVNINQVNLPPQTVAQEFPGILENTDLVMLLDIIDIEGDSILATITDLTTNGQLFQAVELGLSRF